MNINLDNIKKNLPNGYGKIIAEKVGCSESLVWMVANGQKNNLEVTEALIELAETHKRKLQEMAERAARI